MGIARSESTLAQTALAAGTLLFAASALVGYRVAYDPRAAGLRLAFLLGAVAVAAIVAGLGRRGGARALDGLGLASALLAGAIGGYFLATHDWAAGGATRELAGLHRLGLAWQMRRPTLPVPEDIHPNVAAGAIALLVPLGVTYVGRAARRGSYPRAGIAGTAIALGLVALLLSVSRGSWLALGLATVVTVGLGPGSRLSFPSRRRLVGAILIAVALFPLIPIVAARTRAAGRPALWGEMLTLLSDVPFTGAGLAATNMNFSSYVLISHVPYIDHAHNLALQLALEQGILGLGAFLLVTLVALRRALLVRLDRTSPYAGAILLSLLVVLFHGVVDAGGYYSRLVPVEFLPVGAALALPAPPLRLSRRDAGVGLAAGVTLLAVLALGPTVRARWQSNLGAVAQARVELSRYRWPEWPVQDALRVSDAIDLAPAITRYEAALAIHPADATANRRLGQIALSRGDIAAAQRYLARATAGERPTGQLVGEIHALEGRSASADALWSRLSWRSGDLEGRRWWYEQSASPDAAAAFARAVERFASSAP